MKTFTQLRMKVEKVRINLLAFKMETLSVEPIYHKHILLHILESIIVAGILPILITWNHTYHTLRIRLNTFKQFRVS